LREDIGNFKSTIGEDESRDSAADLFRDIPGFGKKPEAQVADFSAAAVYLRQHPDVS
jgi:hypothetical protein